MTREPGTYLLLLRAASAQPVRVGSWGVLDVRNGYYLYIGSAFGPGGIAARVLRHCRVPSSQHWHIDYLRAVAVPVAAWCCRGERELEHRWARALCAMPGLSAVPGFGCSDCRCGSHLFRSAARPATELFRTLPGSGVECVRLFAALG